jgi:catechol 2,3-dioxygenase-like lactoylglutathione lyase family enzyme
MTIDNYSAGVPVIGTADVAGTVAWFEKTLGFEHRWSWGEPPVYAGLQAGGAMLYVCHDPELARAIRELHLAPDVFLWVKDIDEIYEQHQANGAEIVEPLAARPWGVRQYVVRDPNGYQLKIAESDEEAEA